MPRAGWARNGLLVEALLRASNTVDEAQVRCTINSSAFLVVTCYSYLFAAVRVDVARGREKGGSSAYG